MIVEWLEKPLPELIQRSVHLKPSKESIQAVIGPRRVGKTSIMFLTIKQLLEKVNRNEILFLDFEDNRLAGISSSHLDELFVAHREVTGVEPHYLFFDEIQEAPIWSKFIRRLHNTGKYFIILSGSSSKLLSKEVATELRGRYTSVLLLPFSFKEFLQLKGFSYDKTIPFSEKKGLLLRLFDEYMSYGGFPLLAQKELNEKKDLVKTYYETTFYKDIVERYNVKSVDIMQVLMNHILDNNSSLFSITSFEKMLKGRGTEVSKKTISLYLNHLEDAFFIFSSSKFSYSAKVRSLNPKKVYLSDNSFQTFLSPAFNPDNGKRLEAIVMQELKRRDMETFYFKGKKECDFILKRSNELEAVQVTYALTPTTKDREINGLLEAMGEIKASKGLILTFDQEENIQKDGKRINVKPVWKWLLEE